MEKKKNKVIKAALLQAREHDVQLANEGVAKNAATTIFPDEFVKSNEKEAMDK